MFETATSLIISIFLVGFLILFVLVLVVQMRVAYYYILITLNKVRLVEIENVPGKKGKKPINANAYSIYKWDKDTNIALYASGQYALGAGDGWAIYNNGKQFREISGFRISPRGDLEKVVANVLAHNRWKREIKQQVIKGAHKSQNSFSERHHCNKNEIIQCENCEFVGISKLDLNGSSIHRCSKCGHVFSYVWCEQCELGGDFVDNIDDKPSSYICMGCDTEIFFKNDMYTNIRIVKPSKLET